jgi:hypothetical protein
VLAKAKALGLITILDNKRGDIEAGFREAVALDPQCAVARS